MLIAEQKLDDASIVTALLHDTIEDTLSTYSEIALRFGDEIAQLVDGVTKLTNLELSSVENEQAENFRKLLMAMSKDLRVLLVKLADRLHNMRTIRYLQPEKQQRKARETMDIYRAARRPHGHAVDARGARGHRLQGAEPRGAQVDHPPLRQAPPRVAATSSPRSPRTSAPSSKQAGRRGRGPRAREEALLDLAQDGGEEGELLPPLRHLRLPHRHRLGRRLLHRARRRPPALAGGAGAVQGLYHPAEVERLPLDPHHRLGPRRQARRGADSAPPRCMPSPRPASRRTGPTATASASRTPSPSIPSAGCARSPSGSRARRTRTSSSTSSSRCSPTRSSASPPRARW